MFFALCKCLAVLSFMLLVEHHIHRVIGEKPVFYCRLEYDIQKAVNVLGCLALALIAHFLTQNRN